MSKVKKILLVQPESSDGNFAFVAIPRQGLLLLSKALKQQTGPFSYETEVWFEDRCRKLDTYLDLADVDILMISALTNEAPRAYHISREAKQYHPDLAIIGGGPHMSPMSTEALRHGFDVIVNREGEDIIANLCDTLSLHKGANRLECLRRIPGITYLKDGHLEQTKRNGLVDPGFIRLPDFEAIRGLSPGTPMLGGIMETTRGCIENCTYCQVVQQFQGYRMVASDIERARLDQIRALASDGLIHTTNDGKLSVHISDALHIPPLRAIKYRDERLRRLKQLKQHQHTENMIFSCQVRAEVATDDEVMDAMLEAGIMTLFIGVESNNAENLKLVKKRQDPCEVDSHLRKLRERGFKINAQTMIGFPNDSEESIMKMTDWIMEVSDLQTVNWLTPLPATSNWRELIPLDENGEVLPVDTNGTPLPGHGVRPYNLYTGRQLVHKDNRWTMAESRELYDRYNKRLRSLDAFYMMVRNASISFYAAKRWVPQVAAFFRSIPSLAEQIELFLKKPTEDGVQKLWDCIREKTDGIRDDADIIEGKNAVESFTKLFGGRGRGENDANRSKTNQ